MADFLDDLKEGSYDVMSKFIWIPIVIFGILLFFISKIPFIENIEYLSQAISTAGTTVISAVVFTTIVKSRQFTDIFKKQLRSIIYCTEHLSNRKDIKNLWMSASKSMYEKNFPDLCDKIETNLEKYIPIESSKYYENYVYKVDISFDENNEDYIMLRERETFILISNEKKSTKYLSHCIFRKVDYNDSISDYKMKTFKINGADKFPNNELIIDRNYKGNKIRISHERTLRGSEKYNIEKEEEKKYSLKVENTKSHTCTHIFKDYTLEVTHPKELEVKFYENGTLNNFEKKPIRNISGGSIVQRFEYDGIMFKNQGTRLIFRDLINYYIYLSFNIYIFSYENNN